MEEIKKILIIDDDPNILEIYGRKLGGEGFGIVKTLSPIEGLEIAKIQHPDLIILDVLMPEKNGIEVLNDLRKDQSTSRIPVIILSNLSDEKTVKEISKYSTNFYALKSMTDPQALVGLVKEALYGER